MAINLSGDPLSLTEAPVAFVSQTEPPRDVHNEIYHRLLRSFVKASTYELKVRRLIKEYLPVINKMGPDEITPIIKEVRSLIQREEWPHVMNMFKGLFVLLVQEQNPNLSMRTLSEFITKYPEYNSQPEAEKYNLLEYRNMVVAAMRVFEVKGKKAEFFDLIGRMFGEIHSINIVPSVAIIRRMGIFERETGVQCRPKRMEELVKLSKFEERLLEAKRRRREEEETARTAKLLKQTQKLMSSSVAVPGGGPPAALVMPESFLAQLSSQEEAVEGNILLQEAISHVAEGYLPITIARAPLHANNGAYEVNSALLMAVTVLARGYSQGLITNTPKGATYYPYHQATPATKRTQQELYSAGPTPAGQNVRRKLDSEQVQQAQSLQDRVHHAGVIAQLQGPPTASNRVPVPSRVLSIEVQADPALLIHGAIGLFAAEGASTGAPATAAAQSSSGAAPLTTLAVLGRAPHPADVHSLTRTQPQHANHGAPGPYTLSPQLPDVHDPWATQRGGYQAPSGYPPQPEYYEYTSDRGYPHPAFDGYVGGRPQPQYGEEYASYPEFGGHGGRAPPLAQYGQPWLQTPSQNSVAPPPPALPWGGNSGSHGFPSTREEAGYGQRFNGEVPGMQSTLWATTGLLRGRYEPPGSRELRAAPNGGYAQQMLASNIVPRADGSYHQNGYPRPEARSQLLSSEFPRPPAESFNLRGQELPASRPKPYETFSTIAPAESHRQDPSGVQASQTGLTSIGAVAAAAAAAAGGFGGYGGYGTQSHAPASSDAYGATVHTAQAAHDPHGFNARSYGAQPGSTYSAPGMGAYSASFQAAASDALRAQSSVHGLRPNGYHVHPAANGQIDHQQDYSQYNY